MSLVEILSIVVMMGGPLLYVAGITCVFHAFRRGTAVHPLGLTAFVIGIVWTAAVYGPSFVRIIRGKK